MSSTKTFNIDHILGHLRTPLFRNGYALILSTGITSALGLVYWAVAAQFYRTEDVGLNSAAISIMIFLSGIAQVNLQETMIRYIPEAGKRTTSLVLYTYGIVLVTSALVGLVFCLGLSVWSPALSFLTASPAMMAWFILAVMVWGIFVLEDSILVGLRQAVWVPVENAVFSAIKVGLLILLATTYPRQGIFISWTFAVLIIIIPVNILLFRKLIPQHTAVVREQQTSRIPLRQIFKYVAGNYVAALFANMASTLLPLIITQMEGAEANAHFYLAWTIAGALQIAVANMATSLTVEATIHKDDHDEYERRAIIGIVRIVLPVAALMILAAPLILSLMGQSYVDEGVTLLRLLALSAIPNIYNAVYISMARARNEIRGIMAVYVANAILVLSLSHLLLPRLGITGVGIAWVISQTVIALALIIVTRRTAASERAVLGARNEL